VPARWYGTFHQAGVVEGKTAFTARLHLVRPARHGQVVLDGRYRMR
jgi:hypothetical protein